MLSSALTWWLPLAAFGAVYVLVARSIRNERLRVLWAAAGALVPGFTLGFCAGIVLHARRYGPPPDMGGVVGGLVSGAVVGILGALLALLAVVVVWARFRSRLVALCAVLSLCAVLALGVVLFGNR